MASEQTSVDLVIAGARDGASVGAAFDYGCQALGLRSSLVDTAAALRGPKTLARISWHLMGRRPLRLRGYSRSLVETCRRLRPRWLLTVGVAPVSAAALKAIGALGIERINYLTDDPFNPVHRGRWFLKAALEYDTVVSPRRANMQDLRDLGCRTVRYVPFAYDPRHCVSAGDPARHSAPSSDIIFVGGGDRDRLPFMTALLDAGFDLALYGGYWDRFPGTRRAYRGNVPPAEVCAATQAAKVAVCMVRRANRDGHVMRSFEIPAIGACMLVEDTAEHREIFGPDGERVVYFSNVGELVSRARGLLADDAERARLTAAVHRHIADGRNTYADRLRTILDLREESSDTGLSTGLDGSATHGAR